MTITTLKIGMIPGAVQFKGSQYRQDLHFISLRNSASAFHCAFLLDWLPTDTGLASPGLMSTTSTFRDRVDPGSQQSEQVSAWTLSHALGSVTFPFLHQMSATCTEIGGCQFPQSHGSSSGKQGVSNRERGNLILQGSWWNSLTRLEAPCSLWWKRHASILQVVKVKEHDLFLISWKFSPSFLHFVLFCLSPWDKPSSCSRDTSLVRKNWASFVLASLLFYFFLTF